MKADHNATASDATPALPANPFAEDSAEDTINKCASVTEFLSDAIPSIGFSGTELSDSSSHGVAWILNGVTDALRHAESTMAAARKAEQ
ncbi:hypothetical protein [Algiphilus aromaticivorans]|uniref:hypothetical protein n=1 Tax=Algiphilus aromaticivorans TaxID=382454 RepID=UPI0005C1E75B|nr:hypothetical protein [Algiphilus aromaticivorans]